MIASYVAVHKHIEVTHIKIHVYTHVAGAAARYCPTRLSMSEQPSPVDYTRRRMVSTRPRSVILLYILTKWWAWANDRDTATLLIGGNGWRWTNTNDM